jgi:signal transduction histidine kinase
MAEMRALIYELRPEALETEGLVGALMRLATAMRARYHQEVQTELSQEPDLPFEVKEALFRIAREALHNAVKHAHAGEVTVRLVDSHHVALDVQDNGVGFDPQGALPGHLGIRSMRERAESLHGSRTIDSGLGHGTRVRAVFPKP